MSSSEQLTMAHQWGSYPAATIGEYVDTLADTVGPYLAFGIPDAEINVHGRKRDDWVVGNMIGLEALLSIKVVKQGDYTGYDDMSKLDVYDALDPDELDLGYYDMATQSLPALQMALAEHQSLAHLPMQVGIPGDMQIPTLAFGPDKIGVNLGAHTFNKYALPFVEANRRELRRLTSDGDLERQGLAIQFEYPVETLTALSQGLSVIQPLAATILRQVAKVPRNTPTALHFCYCRHRGKPMNAPDPEEPGAYEPVIELINQTIAGWPRGQRLPKVVGIPVIAEGGDIPSSRAIRNIVAQLKDVDLPEETMLAPGTVTRHTTIEELVALNGDIQDAIARPVAVSAPCGMASLRDWPGAARVVIGRQAVVVKKLRSQHGATVKAAAGITRHR